MIDIHAVQSELADRLAAVLDGVAAVVADVPVSPHAGVVYVAPADDWLTADADDESFCGVSVGLVAELVAGTLDPSASLEWIATVLSLLWSGCSAGIDVAGDVTRPLSAGRPSIAQDGTGSEWIVCRVEFARLRVEED